MIRSKGRVHRSCDHRGALRNAGTVGERKAVEAEEVNKSAMPLEIIL